MVYELRSQPFKAAYITFEMVVTLLFRIPLWTLAYLSPFDSTSRNRSILQVLLVNTLQQVNAVFEKTDVVYPFSSATFTKAHHKAVSVPAAPECTLTEELRASASTANVSPADVQGYWIDGPDGDVPVGTLPRKGEKVLYAVHGGGFIYFSAHPNDPNTSGNVKIVLRHCNSIHRAFAIDYRLSKMAPYAPANPFPAALLDALAGYIYLVHDVGFAPDDIILAGDSAGANIALALARYLVENRSLTPALPSPPGALLLLSPWADLSGSDNYPCSTARTHLHTDFLRALDGPGMTYSSAAYIGPHDAHNRFLSSASTFAEADFYGFPRTMIVAGGGEIFLTSIGVLLDRMRRDMGSDGVYYHEEPHAAHDFLCLPFHDAERARTGAAIAKWLLGKEHAYDTVL